LSAVGLVALLCDQRSAQQVSAAATELLVDRDIIVRTLGPCTVPSMAGFIARAARHGGP
jgi:hypothetical protein